MDGIFLLHPPVYLQLACPFVKSTIKEWVKRVSNVFFRQRVSPWHDG
jgi:hypothetical protein